MLLREVYTVTNPTHLVQKPYQYRERGLAACSQLQIPISHILNTSDHQSNSAKNSEYDIATLRKFPIHNAKSLIEKDDFLSCVGP